jgi:hypothetical protein
LTGETFDRRISVTSGAASLHPPSKAISRLNPALSCAAIGSITSGTACERGVNQSPRMRVKSRQDACLSSRKAMAMFSAPACQSGRRRRNRAVTGSTIIALSLRAPSVRAGTRNTYGPVARTPTGAPMFVTDAFECFGMWANAYARAAWLWSIELDRWAAMCSTR